MKYGLIGEKLSHSFSPQIHALFGNKDYEAFEISKDKLDEYMIRRDFCGINITIPYKKAVMKHCDYISDAAKKIGCVNTIINREGVLYGYNTDYDGLLYMCKSAGADFDGAKVLILGSGGTSLTAHAVVTDQNAREVVTISRDGVDNYDNIEAHYDSDIIINTTPVGMYPNRQEIPLNIENFQCLSGVFDVIYNPITTSFLQQAKEIGIPYMGGLSMLISQAYYANKLFFDAQEDISMIEKVEKKLSHAVKNIVLIGMPGCGKTTVGTVLAKKIGLRFVDTDRLIVKQFGMEISEIFKQNGEEYFRGLESAVINQVCESKMQVISTGGGSVLAKSNRTVLGWDGIIIWLDRDIKSLDTKNRPLSVGVDSLTKLYEQRKPIYKQFADVVVDCNKPIDDIVAEIIDYLK